VLDDLLKFYLSEGVGKQVLKKIPYFLMIALVLYLATIWSVPNPKVSTELLLIPTLSLVVFVISTFYFLGHINQGMAKAYGHLDFKTVVAKFRSVYEGQSSMIDDINIKSVNRVFGSAVVNGFSILIAMVSAFLIMLLQSGIGLTIPIVTVFFGTIYIVYDASKSSFIEEPESKADNPIGFDFFEKYAVANSLRRLPRRLRSRSFMYVGSRLIGPLIHIEVPKFMYDVVLVYDNPELVEVIKKMIERESSVGIYLKQEAGETVDQFFVENPNVDKITVLVEQSPMKVFPYLLDPKYAEWEKPKKGWSAFQVIDAHSGRIVGRLFAHRFRGVFVKTIIKKERTVREEQRRGAYQFTFLGERGFMQYVKTQIEINSAKVPPEILRMEVEP
jgi:hypothetical protein